MSPQETKNKVDEIVKGASSSDGATVGLLVVISLLLAKILETLSSQHKPVEQGALTESIRKKFFKK